jgi:hypothetical protein
MKSSRINAYSQMEDEMYISDELAELLYERWLTKMRESVEKENERRRKLRQDLWNVFFIANICYTHDREYCGECRVHATATCPSVKEEVHLPHDF